MFQIHETTISERKDGKARLSMQISDHEDLDEAKQYVVLSVLIDCDENAAYRLEWMQSRALTVASTLIGEVAEKCERAVSRSK